MEARVDVVVVTFNSERHIEACLDSLLNNRRLGVVIVVDNKSTDNTLLIVTEKFPGVRIVQTGANLGFGSAANRGLATMRDSEYVCILNPDTVVDFGAIDVLSAFLDDHKGVAIVGPRVRNLDGTVYPSARSFPKPLTALGHALVGVFWKDNPISSRYRTTDLASPDWVSGTAMLARRAALDQVGGFDERYFMYVEDLDLCWRLRQARWQIGYCVDAGVQHEIGGSSTEADTGVSRSLILEHHRSAWRFARRSTVGSQSVLLPFYAVALGVRLVLTLAQQTSTEFRRNATRRG
jgi:N-acetylglucosaminyl-diphospho-decaprenol L-rhamnosyltransferase